MRIRKFVAAQTKQSQGAFSLESIKNNAPELYEAASRLSPAEISKLLLSKSHAPLDLVALIYHTNPTNFSKALQQYIIRVLRSNSDLKRWLSEMELEPEDAAGIILTNMLNDDPQNRGVLNEIVLDGSHARSYNYERAKNSDIAQQLRNSLQPNQVDLMVPHCPTCSKAGVEKPLWSANVENGTINVERGMSNQQCTTTEEIVFDKLDDTEFNSLKEQGTLINTTNQTETYQISPTRFIYTDGTNNFGADLTNNQVEALKQGLRNFDIINGSLVFRCTFQAKIPSLSAFLGYRVIKDQMSRLWRTWLVSMGRDPEYTAKMEELQKLQEKESKGELSPREYQELRKLRRYKDKKDKEFIPGITRLDAPIGDSDEQKSGYETLQQQDTGDISSEDIQNAEMELINLLGEENFSILDRLVDTRAEDTEILNVIEGLQNWYNSPRHQQESAKNSYKQSLLEAARYYIYGPQEDGKARICQVCGTEAGPTDKYCSYALHLQKEIYDNYYKATSFSEFQKSMNKITEKAQQHYQVSNIEKVVNNLLGGIDVVEDDIFEGLDLSEFESYADEDEEDLLEVTKLNRSDFYTRVDSELSPQERAAFYGTTLKDTSEDQHEVEQEDPNKIKEIAEKIDQLIRKVEDEDLLEELMILRRA